MSDRPGHIPGHWGSAEVAELSEFVTSGSRGWAKYYADTGPLFLRVGNLRHDTVAIDLSDAAHVRSPQGAEGERTRVQPGDILLTITAEVGMVGLAASGMPEAYVNQHVALIRPQSTVWAPGLAYAFLDPQGLQALARKNQYGATKPGLSLIQVRSFRVGIPPTGEQRRIVEAIDSYFTRLDNTAATLERVQRNLKRYRASVLKAAVEGRLVPTEAELARAEGRDYEPASALLERVRAERRRRWDHVDSRGSYKEPVEPDATDLPELPAGWSWATMDSLADLKGGITKGQARGPNDVLRPVSYLRVANVQRGRLDLSIVKTIPATEAEIDELRLHSGDVLFNEGGDRDKLGRGWIWNGELPECIHQNHVFRARMFTGDLQPKFVSWYGNAIAGQRYFFEQGKQTTNLASINLKKLRSLPVPVPPLVEQLRIVEEAQRLLSLADEAEVLVDVNIQRCARLRQSILKWAFEGKLADQDPNEEPATALLERIRRETLRAVSSPRRDERKGTMPRPRSRPRARKPSPEHA